MIEIVSEIVGGKLNVSGKAEQNNPSLLKRMQEQEHKVKYPAYVVEIISDEKKENHYGDRL